MYDGRLFHALVANQQPEQHRARIELLLSSGGSLPPTRHTNSGTGTSATGISTTGIVKKEAPRTTASSSEGTVMTPTAVPAAHNPSMSSSTALLPSTTLLSSGIVVQPQAHTPVPVQVPVVSQSLSKQALVKDSRQGTEVGTATATAAATANATAVATSAGASAASATTAGVSATTARATVKASKVTPLFPILPAKTANLAKKPTTQDNNPSSTVSGAGAGTGAGVGTGAAVAGTATATATGTVTGAGTGHGSMTPEALPIDAFREEILSRIAKDRVTIIHGETGCGKSSRLPLFLLENSESSGCECRMMISQPRRIAASSLMKRLRSMPNVGDKVGLRMGEFHIH